MSRGRTLKGMLVVLAIIAAVYVLAAVVHTQGPGNDQGLKLGLYKGHQVVAGEVLVKLREDARLAPMPQDFDVDRDDQIGDGSIRRVHSRSHNVDTLLARLSDFEEVEYAEPNYIVYALMTPNDPYYGNLWGMLNISAPLAWDTYVGDRGNVVAVVDTGVNYNHPDLAANAWSAPAGGVAARIGGVDILCGSGTHGFNAITKTCDPMDDNNHGTHVSGTIGAAGNNGVGVVGVNWAASIMGLKFLNAQGSGTTADAVNAIEFAVQAKIAGVNVRVLSNSWGGGGYSKSLFDEIVRANQNGILFVAAAGNNGTSNDTTPFYPASYSVDNVIAVAATDGNDILASFSNYGASVDLAAPGVSIYSTLRNGSYGYMSGTSMATPHVSGAAALVLDACPALGVAALKSVLLGYVDPVSSLAGRTGTGGRLNVFRAVSNCGTEPPSPPPDFSIAASPGSRSIRRGQSTTFTVTVAPSNGLTGPVALSASATPSGPSLKFGTNPVEIVSTSSGSSVLTVTTTSATPRGTYTIDITGNAAGGLSHGTTVSVRVK